jgi:hypothetical protein
MNVEKMAEIAASWQREQAKRVSTYKPQNPEIPNDGMCAGDCTQSVPPPPAGSLNEPFTTRSDYPLEWLMVVGAVSVVFVILTRL